MAILNVTGDPGDGSLYTNAHLDANGTANSNPNFQQDARAGEGATLLDDPLGAQVLTIGGGMWNNSRTVDRKDARTRIIALTREGKAARKKLVPIAKSIVDRLEADIPEEDLLTTRRTLRRLFENLA